MHNSFPLSLQLKSYLFHKSYPRSFTSSLQTAFTEYCVLPGPFLLSYSVFVFILTAA